MSRLSPTQELVLRALADGAVPPEGRLYGELCRELPGVKLTRATLRRLWNEGLADMPSRDHSGWRITPTGRVIAAQLGGPFRDQYSWEQRKAGRLRGAR